MKNKLPWITLCLLLLALTGCGGKNPKHAAAEQAATDAATAWLELIDKTSYTESWEQSAAPFKNSTTAEKWAAMVKPVREPLGELESRQLANRDYLTSLPNAPDGEYVIIQF